MLSTAYYWLVSFNREQEDQSQNHKTEALEWVF